MGHGGSARDGTFCRGTGVGRSCGTWGSPLNTEGKSGKGLRGLKHIAQWREGNCLKSAEGMRPGGVAWSW